MQDTKLQCHAIQCQVSNYSAVQCSAVENFEVKNSTVYYSTVQRSILLLLWANRDQQPISISANGIIAQQHYEGKGSDDVKYIATQKKGNIKN